eukprot:1158861-Pelagomonas_calceolata.AAC.3
MPLPIDWYIVLYDGFLNRCSVRHRTRPTPISTNGYVDMGRQKAFGIIVRSLRITYAFFQPTKLHLRWHVAAADDAFWAAGSLGRHKGSANCCTDAENGTRNQRRYRAQHMISLCGGVLSECAVH